MSNRKKSVPSTTLTEIQNEDRALETKLDKQVVYEFGGPLGVTAMMLGFPVLMYYFWICLDFYLGALVLPKNTSQLSHFFDLAELAYPTTYAATIYIGFCLFQLVLAYVMPGPVVYGLPVPSLNYQQIPYICNGVSSWYVTLVVSFVLHYFRIFRLTEIVDNFAPIMTVAIISGFVVTIVTYAVTVYQKKGHRMSGNLIYDIFMGAALNPRLGKIDLKLWAEIRVPWPILFYITLSALLKQWEIYGRVSTPLVFMTLAHFLYVNACMKGEECIPTTWDIFYEKWGFMLIFWNLAGVPFTYCYSSLYLLKFEPYEHNPIWTVFCFVLLLSGYYIWDTANSQKNRFRMQIRGTYIPRKTFPQLPWGTLEKPSYIKTKQGNLLLTSGWYGIARKIHYTADLMMALSWGFITGFSSFLPYFYVTFFILVLTHRVSRDMERCAKKYGDDWKIYCKKVPYIFIPYVY